MVCFSVRDSWQPLVGYIDQVLKQYLNDETRVNRKNIEDHRVHCCLYFINPSQHGYEVSFVLFFCLMAADNLLGVPLLSFCPSPPCPSPLHAIGNHSLKPLDIVTLSKLHQKVNVIPLIAKADTLSKNELKELKQRLLDEFAEHNINIFRPTIEEDDDEADKANNMSLLAAMPFAVIGSNGCISLGGKVVRGRQYPWGVVEGASGVVFYHANHCVKHSTFVFRAFIVENEDHCDFAKLRDMLVRYAGLWLVFLLFP